MIWLRAAEMVERGLRRKSAALHEVAEAHDVVADRAEALALSHRAKAQDTRRFSARLRRIADKVQGALK